MSSTGYAAKTLHYTAGLRCNCRHGFHGLMVDVAVAQKSESDHSEKSTPQRRDQSAKNFGFELVLKDKVHKSQIFACEFIL